MNSIYTGVAGMRASQQSIDVIANNVANVNTTAYKAGRVTFEEALVRTMANASANGTNPMQVGTGVAVGTIDNIMTQGNQRETGRTLDLAVVGNGFFVVNDGAGNYYTREGVFTLDRTNRLVMGSNGMSVMGWQADLSSNTIPSTNTAPAQLTIPLGIVYAIPTSQINFGGNLNAADVVGGHTASTLTVYDSIGSQHALQITFTKTGDNTWSWQAASADAAPASDPGSGTLTFDDTGHLLASTGTISLAYANPNGATSPQEISFDFSQVCQLDGAYDAAPLTQNGLQKGTLENYAIDGQGIITGSFSNGATRLIGQLALCAFSNPAGLSKEGNSLWRPTANSGDPRVGSAETVSSKIRSGYLETSNVDLATEFANLIVTQRSFQANSRTITTADEMMQEVMTLKR